MARTDQPPEEHRYELARTYYFLSSRYAGDSASDDGRRVNAFPERSVRSPFAGDQYRKQATDLLEQLVREYPDAADYRFLLALCYRPRGIVSEPQQGSGNSRGRERSLKILEALKTEYPQVVDYRYELAATYAWLQVGLFPWQGRATALSTAERELRQALAETQWLVDHNPTIPRYTRCKALVLAKLATVSAESDRLAEAADLYEQALQTQEALVSEFPDLPDHDRVLREFFRLRLAAAYHRNDALEGRKGRSRARKLLEACVHNLTELAARSNLTEDRLASISLNIAEDAYRRLPSE
jgi:hypothetical protein